LEGCTRFSEKIQGIKFTWIKMPLKGIHFQKGEFKTEHGEYEFRNLKILFRSLSSVFYPCKLLFCSGSGSTRDEGELERGEYVFFLGVEVVAQKGGGMF
jgi:hypothetical protein